MADETTPMMRQYREIKDKYPDSLLFYRMGDFYELFFEDAVETSRLLELTLTKRHDVPMCGVPYHSVDQYLARIIRAGRKVAICDQMEDPRTAKGIVKREVTQVITPGTIIDNTLLEQRANNYLASFIVAPDGTISFGVADISTGEFSVTEIIGDGYNGLSDELMRFSPKEIVVPETMIDDASYKALIQRFPSLYISTLPAWVFDKEYARSTLTRHFNVHSLKGFGIEENSGLISVAGGIIHYLSEMQKQALTHIRSVSVYQRRDFMLLDDATQAGLELCENLSSGRRDGTLINAVDETLTGMGARRLKQMMLSPLVTTKAINDRLDRVGFFFQDARLRAAVRTELKSVHDIERLTTKLAVNRVNPKEVAALKSSLIAALRVIDILSAASYADERFSARTGCEKAIDLIERALVDDPPILLNEGGIIKDGFDATLATYNAARREGRDWILKLEERYRTETGIPNLRIRYNNIIGYYVEVSKGQVKNVSADFIKRQTLVGSERYTTKQLSEHESVITEANEKGNDLEYSLFIRVRDALKELLPDLKAVSDSIAFTDVFAGFAECAAKNNYVRPAVNDSEALLIRDGRHPVVEKYLSANQFVPNDLSLDADERKILIITGPNMSGKSTYLRQTALIVLLAQIGSFVPAREATVGVVDRIFTRVGASDNIARGESTFLVEMNETANILNNCTAKSLLIMDEIGRGTSTYDGMSIAWAIIEFLASTPAKSGKTLFATHYHELTLLEELKGVKNVSVLVKEHKGDIVFMKKVVDGPATSSYGIYAAKLAGVPRTVTARAEVILKQLEKDGEVQVNIIEKRGNARVLKTREMLPLFDTATPGEHPLIKEIAETDINTLTPVEALTKIAAWKATIEKS
ncbi:MAG: DNA mismatch repair protein MutS [Spirochaetes bacterium]|nr:DNA mismatch repair protein MutS [Spirochaetota bacterium]